MPDPNLAEGISKLPDLGRIRPPSSHERVAAWTAVGILHVSPREQRALLGQLVDVWRVRWIPWEREVVGSKGWPHVVNSQKKNIFSTSRRGIEWFVRLRRRTRWHQRGYVFGAVGGERGPSIGLQVAGRITLLKGPPIAIAIRCAGAAAIRR